MPSWLNCICIFKRTLTYRFTNHLGRFIVEKEREEKKGNRGIDVTPTSLSRRALHWKKGMRDKDETLHKRKNMQPYIRVRAHI